MLSLLLFSLRYHCSWPALLTTTPFLSAWTGESVLGKSSRKGLLTTDLLAVDEAPYHNGNGAVNILRRAVL